MQIRPPLPDPAEHTKRLIEGVQGATERYREGVRNPRANFKEEALKAKGAWKDGVTKAIAEDSFAKGINQVNADDAIELAATIGADSLAAGVAARAKKIEEKATKMRPLMSAVIQQVRSMPADTEAQRDARVLAQIKGSREVGKKLREK